MNNVLFSIIVPIYKVEAYIRTCVDSLLQQTCQDFEIVLVDDGSPDTCGRICDEYAEKHEIIKAVHKENGGLLSAWKTGLPYATGKYIGSIDSDDFVDHDMLERIKDVIDQYNVDIIVFGYRNVSGEGDRGVANKIAVPEGLYDKHQINNVIIPGLINRGSFEERSNIYLSRVNKFIKRELLLSNEKYYDTEMQFGEDNLWTVPNVLSAESLYIMADYYPYNYRYNPTSITHSYNPGLWQKFQRLDDHLEEILKNKGYEQEICQVYCDSVFHAAVTVNNIMHSEQSKQGKIQLIDEIVKDERVAKGLNYMKPEYCSSKERINLKLMKRKASKSIYIMKKIQYKITGR